MTEQFEQSRREYVAPEIEIDEPVGIVVLWRMLRANLLVIVIPIVLFSLLAGLSALRISDTFSAEAQLIISRGNLEIIEEESGDRELVDSAVVSSAANVLNSRALALQVMEKLDLTNNPSVNPYYGLTEITPSPGLIRRLLIAANLREPDDLSSIDPKEAGESYVLEFLLGSYSAAAVPGSNVVFVRSTTSSPELSAQIANAAVEAYLDFSLNASQQEADLAIEALSARVQSLRQQLQVDQAAFQDAQSKMQLPAQDGLQLLSSELQGLEARASEIRADIARIGQAQTAIDALSGSDGATIAAALNSDPLFGSQTQISLSRQALAASADQDLAIVKSDFEALLTSLRRQYNAIEASRNRLASRIEENNQNAISLSRLEVELETTSAVYASALERLKGLVLQSGLRNEGGRFLLRAEAPLGADSQNRRRLVMIAAVLGGLVGCVIALIREAANDRIRSFKDLPRGQRSFICVEIPKMRSRLSLFNRRRKEKFLLGSPTRFSESIRNCRRIVGEQGSSDDPLVVSVMSALPGEGKSTLCGALARSFVLVGKRTLLIDADLRARDLSQAVLGHKPKVGFQSAVDDASALADNKYIKHVKDLGLDFLPAGEDERNPADVLETEACAHFIERVKKEYDVIVIDTPPLLMFPDARSVASMSNNYVLAAGYNQTTQAALKEIFSVLSGDIVGKMTFALCKTPPAKRSAFGSRAKKMAYY